MNEERMLILRMIQEGKLTADEGAALLEALEKDGLDAIEGDLPKEEAKDGGDIYTGPVDNEKESAKDKGNRKDSDWKEKMETEASRFARDIESAVEKLGEAIEERVEKDVKPALANLPNILSQIPFLANITGQLHKFEKELVGGFAPGASVDLELVTRNGNIEVETWDQSGYKVLLQGKVRAKTDMEALDRMKVIVDVEQTDNKLSIQNTATTGESVAMKVFLPQDNRYKCHLWASNGKVNAKGLKCSTINSRTANGTIGLVEIEADTIESRTSNGMIDLTSVIAKEVEGSAANGNVRMKGSVDKARLRTANGGIRVRPMGAREGSTEGSLYDLDTVNGSISVELSKELQKGCYLDLRSQFSKIKMGLENLQFEINEQRVGHNQIVARGPQSDSVTISVKAKTTSGTISVQDLEQN